MDEYLARRLLLALGITGILSALAAVGHILAGSTPVATLTLWPVPIGLFAIVFLGVGFFGAFRSPAEKYDRTLEDEWDR